MSSLAEDSDPIQNEEGGVYSTYGLLPCINRKFREFCSASNQFRLFGTANEKLLREAMVLKNQLIHKRLFVEIFDQVEKTPVESQLFELASHFQRNKFKIESKSFFGKILGQKSIEIECLAVLSSSSEYNGLLEKVLQLGADPNQRFRYPVLSTPLHCAAQSKNLKGMAILMAHGAVPQKNNSGLTPDEMTLPPKKKPAKTQHAGFDYIALPGDDSSKQKTE
jgi:hypothetical protein